jgi:hypothetical protein
MTQKDDKQVKRYKVVRRVKECFEVYAHNKKEAGDRAESPYSVDIISERVTLLERNPNE